ncbi:hypothetical protein Cylst_5372 [Cylindrospermum stagnale PCC 7417]|uniref:Uncharacterized protein n=1 Tax=Cylindrospermum stagnale PCC 7417 TaxID=56107 RepID=K9X5M6_9NOST|nr:hypothetical protein Cylst_5372 [Cylindrospermum stagnale PCC 7417]
MVYRNWKMGNFAFFQCSTDPADSALIIGNRRGKLPTASIIEFDLLFNAQANNQL